MNTLFNAAPMRILFGLLLLMALFALASVARLNFEKAEYANPMPATISVTGEGEAFAVPDIGQFSFAVNARAEDVTTAQSESATAINEIVTFLTGAGVAEADIKTSNYNVYPRYRYEERICPIGSFCPPGEQVEDGFEVSQMIEVKVRNTAEAGTLISGVGERGATNISGLNFTVDDAATIEAEARELAIADAQEKAETLAAQLGVRLVRIIGFYDETGYDYYAKEEVRMMSMDAVGGEVAEMPVGEEQKTARVNIVYEIK